MNHFIFQARKERYDLQSLLKEGQRVTWYATRYRSEKRPGDIVYFWQSGPPEIRGIYGGGVLASEPYKESGWESHGVDVDVTVVLQSPLLASRIQADKRLQNLMIFRLAAGTNFLISEKESYALRDMCADLRAVGAS